MRHACRRGMSRLDRSRLRMRHPDVAAMNDAPHPLRPSHGPPPAGAPDSAPIRFSVALGRLLERLDAQPVRLGVLLESMHEWGVHLILFLIALPFVTPIPLPGFSLPF